ncbi:ATP-binding cassette domain-containing protein [Lachnospiraceae bacterium ZAX-1]
MDDILLRVKEAKKHYPIRKGMLGKREYVRAVENVSFDVRRGEAFGIVGESGCGKSTLGRLICRLETMSFGDIEFEGRSIIALKKSESRDVCKKVQMIFQEPYASLNPRMSVNDIISEPLIVHKLAKNASERERIVRELLENVGLAAYYANRYPHEFSGGQRQRIGIARALAVHPQLIVADEPVSALDVSIQSQVLNLLNGIKKQYGIAFIFIAHDLSVVEFFSDRIGVMYLGNLVEVASKETLYRNPLHPYSQALLESIPTWGPDAKKKKSLLEGDIPSATSPPPGCKFHTRCRHCMERCKIEEPKKTVVSDEQYVYCHLYDK